MLTIRLQRTGAKNKADFRIVLAQSYRSASKKVLEVLGHYNPRSKNFGIKDPERLNYWISQHVQVSPTVHNLFVEKKLVTSKKVKAWQPKSSIKPDIAPEKVASALEPPSSPPGAVLEPKA